MSNYVGEIGKRVNLNLTLKNEYSYPTYFGYRTQDNYIYTFEDAEGNVFVWKTTSLICIDHEVNGCLMPEFVRKGDSFECKATIKEHSEYKGTKQTVITRVKVLTISHVPTKEELEEKKRQEQMDSLKDGDHIWQMSYRRFKEHYSDCETIAGSYDSDRATIGVIIREGRLVPSGTRFEHYKGFEFTSPDKTLKRVLRAVSEDNAYRRLVKEMPEASTWECTKIYDYQDSHRIW